MSSEPKVENAAQQHIVVPPPLGGPSWAVNGRRLRRITQDILKAESSELTSAHLGAWQVCHDIEGRQTKCKVSIIYDIWMVPEMQNWMGRPENGDHVYMPSSVAWVGGVPTVQPQEGRDYFYGSSGVYDAIGWFRWKDATAEGTTWLIVRYDALAYYSATRRFDFRGNSWRSHMPADALQGLWDGNT